MRFKKNRRMPICRAQARRGMAMAGQGRDNRSGRRQNAARRAAAPPQASGAGQRRGGQAQRQAQDGAARESYSLDVVTPAEIDRVLAAYKKNAEPEVAARMDRKMAEEIIRDRKARIKERIDYNSRVGIPRDLIRAYGLQLA